MRYGAQDLLYSGIISLARYSHHFSPSTHRGRFDPDGFHDLEGILLYIAFIPVKVRVVGGKLEETQDSPLLGPRL